MSLTLRWEPRREPLEPVAVLGLDATRVAFARRLAALDGAHLARLLLVASSRAWCALGAAEDLPWVDGVRYLGRDPAAPALLVPTALAPSVPIAWLARAIASRAASAGPSPWALATNPALVLPVGRARRATAVDVARALERLTSAASSEAARAP